MSYIEGFVLAVPNENKQKFIDHADLADPVFVEQGATRVLECWQDDVKKGHTTDFFGAVDAKDDEAVIFSWIEWPSRDVRQEAMGRLDDLMKTDARFDAEKNPMPFDGKRMIYGGFATFVDIGEAKDDPYVQGFLVAVPGEKKDAYRKMSEQTWDFFREYGALRCVEAWQDDVPEGKQTDFFRAVKAEPGEKVVFSFIEWPSRAVCDAAAEKMRNDERMRPPEGVDMPFDGKRMVYGGFKPVVELKTTN